MTPNVIARIKYYEKDSNNRDFYSSNVKDDYLGYIDKGTTSTRTYDYVDYVGDDDKSYGVFDAYGLLSKEDKKNLREKLRETKSIIWDLVISFEENFGKENIFNYEDANNLIKDILPKFLKRANFDVKNVIWFAGLHENTDNRHIHVSFFEKEPTYYNQKKKQYHFRKGKIKLEYLNELKMNAESFFDNNKELIKEKRKKAVESFKLVVEDKYSFSYLKSFIPSIKRLLEEIPKSGRISYDSRNMEKFRPLVDEVSSFILTYGQASISYKELLNSLDKENDRFKELAGVYGLEYQPDYKEKVIKDLKRRVGNIVINKLIEERDEAFKELKNIQDTRFKRKMELKEIGNIMLKAAKISKAMDEEAEYAFKEYQQRLKAAEYQRLLEEGIIENEM